LESDIFFSPIDIYEKLKNMLQKKWFMFLALL
jgi:hypothetical protein